MTNTEILGFGLSDIKTGLVKLRNEMIMNKQWKHTLDFSGFYKDESIDIAEKGKKIAQIIKLKFSSIIGFASENFDQDLEDIVDGFESITGYHNSEPIESVDEFDDLMESLYDWADYNRVWINVVKTGGL